MNNTIMMCAEMVRLLHEDLPTLVSIL